MSDSSIQNKRKRSNTPGIQFMYSKTGVLNGYKFRCCVGRDPHTRKQIWRTTTIAPDDLRIVDKRRDTTIKNLNNLKTEWDKEQKAEYEKQLAAAEQSNSERQRKAREQITFADFVKIWHDKFVIGKKYKHTPSTISYYEYMSADLVKYFGDYKLSEITTLDVINYLNYLSAAVTKNNKPLSLTTQKRHYQTLQTIFKFAMTVKYIKEDPLSTLSARDKPREEKDRRIDFLDVGEAKKFLECLNEEPIFWKALVSVLINCGLRRGECIGLQWQDIYGIDTMEPMIKVSRNVTVDKTAENKIHIGPPKSGKERVVAMPIEVYNLLLELKESQEETLGINIKDSSFIFSRIEDPDRPIYPTEPTRFMRKFVKKYNLPDVSPHDLRHTAATLAIEYGSTKEQVKDLLGHADVETSEKFYISSTKEIQRRKEKAQRQTVEGIAKLLYGKPENKQYYTVKYVELPDTVHGAVSQNDDGTYMIIINSNLSEKERESALQHELAHIKLNHFNQPDKSVADCETEVD